MDRDTSDSTPPAQSGSSFQWSEHRNPAAVRDVRDILGRFVPRELVDIIMLEADYYAIGVACMARHPVVVSSGDKCIVKIRLSRHHRRNIVGLAVKITGHDQGWSSYRADQGTYNNSWTWYSLKVGTSQPEDLWRNRRAVAIPETQNKVWDRSSDVVSRLRGCGELEIWAHARYPGWRNTVNNASVELFFNPCGDLF